MQKAITKYSLVYVSISVNCLHRKVLKLPMFPLVVVSVSVGKKLKSWFVWECLEMLQGNSSVQKELHLWLFLRVKPYFVLKILIWFYLAAYKIFVFIWPSLESEKPQHLFKRRDIFISESIYGWTCSTKIFLKWFCLKLNKALNHIAAVTNH